MEGLLLNMKAVPTPHQLLAYALLLAIWCVLMTGFLYLVWDGMITGRISYGTAYNMFLFGGLFMLGHDLVGAIETAGLVSAGTLTGKLVILSVFNVICTVCLRCHYALACSLGLRASGAAYASQTVPRRGPQVVQERADRC